MTRDLHALPKAHLHLHVAGAMRESTLRELSTRYGLPPATAALGARTRTWAQFQGRYDAARAAIRTAEDLGRVIVEAAESDAADGCGWLEIQIDPTGYADVLDRGPAEVPRAAAETGPAGDRRAPAPASTDRTDAVATAGLRAAIEAALAGAAAAPIPVGVIVASSWARSPEHALRLAELAAEYSGAGVVGFGLSNDERHGKPRDYVAAFEVAAEAGLLRSPHGGFYTGPYQVRDCVELLGADRIGHGTVVATDPATMALLAERQVALEVCPTSYPPMGVHELAEIPVAELLAAGVPVTIGSDDPLLFGTGLAGQYRVCREALGLSDEQLATLARCGVTHSAAPPPVKAKLSADIDAWLAAPDRG